MDIILDFLTNLFSTPTPAKVEPPTTPEPISTPPPPPFVIPSIKVSTPRKLDTALEDLLDKKLMEIKPEEIKKAILSRNANLVTKLAGDAFTALQIREATNNNDGIWVEKIQSTVGGQKGDPWCMDQQQAQVAYAEKKTGLVSKLPASGSCAIVRQKCPAILQQKVSDSQPGDIWVWEHNQGTGHAGNFSNWIEPSVSANLNEGNTSGGKIGDVIVREGGGSYFTARSVKPTGDMVLKMCIRPF